jgi:FkbM family methyltransferase
MINDLIFDIGMHEGDDAEYYLAKGFRVLSVDANPFLCEKARKRFAREIRYGRLTVLNLGITECSGELDFYITTNKTDWSSFRYDFASRFDGLVETIKVRCITMASLIKEYGVPYYLKIDIEGHDQSAILSLDKVRDELPRYVSVEATVDDFVDIMTPLGYRYFKLVNQVYISHIPPCRPPIEGAFTEMKIISGLHSGQFGDESYGEWLTPEDFLSDYSAVREKRYSDTRQKDYGLSDEMLSTWWDIHAKLGPK